MNRATVVGQVRLNNSNRKRGGAALSRAKMALSAAAMVGFMGGVARAANATIDSWLGTTNGDWAGGAWSTGAAPNATTVDANFNLSSYSFSPSIGASYSVGDLIFGPNDTSGIAIGTNSSSYALTILGDTGNEISVASTKGAGNSNGLTVQNNSILTFILMNSGSGAVTINPNISSTGNGTAIANFSATNTLTINGNISLGFSIVTAGTGNITINGILSGAKILDMAGTGTVTINNANLNTGGDYVEAGTALLGDNTALGPAADATTLGATIGSNSATLLTTTPSVYSGGTVTIGNNINVGRSANTTGTLTLGGGAATSSSYTGTITLLDAVTLSQVPNGTVTFTKAISGAFPVTVTGGGTVSLTAVETYSGATTISNGTLQLSGNGTILKTPSITIASGGTFDVSQLSGYSLLGASPAQAISGTGTVLGNLTVPSGATIIPGYVSGTSNVGAFNVANLTLGSGANYNISLGTPGTSLSSLGTSGILNVSGNLTLPSTGLKLNLSDNAGAFGGGSAGTGYYELFSYGGLSNYSPSDFSITLPSSLTGDLVTFTNTGSQLDVQFSPPPVSLTWTGAANNGSWDNSSTNWKNNGTLAAAMYADPNSVTFADAGGGGDDHDPIRRCDAQFGDLQQQFHCLLNHNRWIGRYRRSYRHHHERHGGGQSAGQQHIQRTGSDQCRRHQHFQQCCAGRFQRRDGGERCFSAIAGRYHHFIVHSNHDQRYRAGLRRRNRQRQRCQQRRRACHPGCQRQRHE